MSIQQLTERLSDRNSLFTPTGTEYTTTSRRAFIKKNSVNAPEKPFEIENYCNKTMEKIEEMEKHQFQSKAKAPKINFS